MQKHFDAVNGMAARGLLFATAAATMTPSVVENTASLLYSLHTYRQSGNKDVTKTEKNFAGPCTKNKHNHVSFVDAVEHNAIRSKRTSDSTCTLA